MRLLFQNTAAGSQSGVGSDVRQIGFRLDVLNGEFVLRISASVGRPLGFHAAAVVIFLGALREDLQ